jgi:hypothetical protein
VPEEPALRYGLAHQQLAVVAQLEYAAHQQLEYAVVAQLEYAARVRGAAGSGGRHRRSRAGHGVELEQSGDAAKEVTVERHG